MRVMAMVMVAGQHERFKLRDRPRLVNSKEVMGVIGIRDGLRLHLIEQVSSRSTPGEKAC